MRELKDKNNFNESQKGLLLGMIDKEFCKKERDQFLQCTNSKGIMTRPIWKLMTHLSMFKGCQHDGLINSLWLEDRIVNLPSSAKIMSNA